MLTHSTAALYMVAPSFEHHCPVLILLHCIGCLKQDNFTGVAKELGVDIGTIGHSVNLEHFHRPCKASLKHPYDPSKALLLYYYCSDYCTVFDVVYVAGKKRTHYLVSSRM